MKSDMKETRYFQPGEVIFKEGDPPGALYIIASGTVEIARGVGEDRVVLAERGENDVFGEMALVDNQPRSATATAISEVQAYVLAEETFSQYLTELNPVIAHVFRSLVQNIREMNETQTLLAHVLNLRNRAS